MAVAPTQAELQQFRQDKCAIDLRNLLLAMRIDAAIEAKRKSNPNFVCWATMQGPASGVEEAA